MNNKDDILIMPLLLLYFRADMILFSKRNLIYKDYTWTVYSTSDPRVFGIPDSTIFNSIEGNEVVYIINKLMILWNYRFSNTGNKIEKLIHDKLPAGSKSQEEVQAWIKENLEF
ncbi:MAG TPA: hypothetical protein DIT07_02600 [Sphingobacteriaceae bacterium]|nr:hypothetical protein [Sphingobacteriaceae bacterium]